MVDTGAHFDGLLACDLKKLDNGYVVPDVSLSEIHDQQRKHVREQLDLAVRADELGYDYLINPENHFDYLGSTSPNPLQIQTAAAPQTEEIRFLQIANILTWHQPVRLAEQIATLDVISDGRIEAGVGTGSGMRQMSVFLEYLPESIDGEEDVWENFLEAYDVLRAAWSQDSFHYDGEYHTLPPEDLRWEVDQEFHYLADDVSGCDPHDFMSVEDGDTMLDSLSVFPQPQQRPHPQVWKPVASPRSAEWTARQGINACTYCTSFEDVEELVDVYYEAAEDEGWPDHRPEYDGEPFAYGWDEQRKRGLAAEVKVFNTEVASEEAIERMKLGLESLISFRKSTLPPEKAAKLPIDSALRIEEREVPIVGDTEEIVDQLAKYREVCGYEDFVVFATLGIPGLTYEQKRTQLESFAEDVVPYFAED